MEPAHQPCMGATDQDRSSPGNEGGRTGRKERRRGGERSERWERGQGGKEVAMKQPDTSPPHTSVGVFLYYITKDGCRQQVLCTN